MIQRISELRDYIINKKHHIFRQTLSESELKKVIEIIRNPEDSYMKRVANRLILFLDMEKPVILPDEKICFLRTIRELPDIYTEKEWDFIKNTHYIHEKGKVCNISSDYAVTLALGLENRREEALMALSKCKDDEDREGIEFLECVINIIDAVERLADRYSVEAEASQKLDLAAILKRVVRYGAHTFYEALQFFRILHYTLWCAGNYHNTVGRFDQYMYPYLKADLDTGRINEDTAFELLEEFFLSFNRDSDLYPGMQQGDNGQSLVLGGIDIEGNEAYNKLSEMCLKASLELKVIDPKINLRVSSKTPIEVYNLGTLLTKQGLGFPQYSNDDIVIPGLLEKGYELKDAKDYVVAACWEFIIPGLGMDIPNIGALPFAGVVRKCIDINLRKSKNFDEFMEYIRSEVYSEINAITDSFNNIYLEPAPFQSILMDDCIRNAIDISKGSKYNNFGLHGTGLSTAADSLAVIKKYLFEEHTVSSEELLEMLDNNFIGREEFYQKFRYDAPKMGNNDDYVDNIASTLLNIFADSLEDKRNERGGCYRAGTGSAMYYIWHAKMLGATPDGRKKDEPLSANYSPSIYARLKGPVSVIRSFTKPDLKRVINGGPLTLEIHDTVFRNEESIEKVAMLVKSFIDYGGHQLQLNAVNKETLLQAQQKPEEYRNLIVRVWGWSAYFVELDKEYQDHIIRRIEFAI
jgi:pyruvate-formate lyase